MHVDETGGGTTRGWLWLDNPRALYRAMVCFHSLLQILWGFIICFGNYLLQADNAPDATSSFHSILLFGYITGVCEN